ncbi:MAG TPA: DUF2510 domain-containing protein [Actinomycetes bacterium]|nr:DUF2510 domain-containing protein [Actinomycetes bacterium]
MAGSRARRANHRRQLTPRPGWYPDPECQGYQRYWNGQQWTEHRAAIRLPAARPRFRTANDELREYNSKTAKAIFSASQTL